MNDAAHFPIPSNTQVQHKILKIPSKLTYLRLHRLPLSNCTGGVDVSTLIQTAKSCLILALNIHQNPYDSDLTRECNTMQRLIDSSNGKPLATLTWPKREWETIKALAAIVSGHRSFAEGRLRLRKYVQSRSLLASIRSTAGLSYLFLCYLGVKLLYLLNGVFPTHLHTHQQTTDIQTYVHNGMQWLCLSKCSGGTIGAREPDARRAVRALPAVRLQSAGGPLASPRLVAHWPVSARRLLRRRYPRARQHPAQHFPMRTRILLVLDIIVQNSFRY